MSDQYDPRAIIEKAAVAAGNGHAQPTAPPLEMVLQNCQIDVGDGVDQATGAKMKVMVITHVSGGARFIVPLPHAAARTIGNGLCGRPDIALPGS